jgi:hypothetical protein
MQQATAGENVNAGILPLHGVPGPNDKRFIFGGKF